MDDTKIHKIIEELQRSPGSEVIQNEVRKQLYDSYGISTLSMKAFMKNSNDVTQVKEWLKKSGYYEARGTVTVYNQLKPGVENLISTIAQKLAIE